MSKKLFPFLVIIILIVLGSAVYFLTRSNIQEVSNTAKPYNQTMTDETQLSELPADWRTYTSPEWEFAINHPPDVKIEKTQNGEHFFKLGKTQRTGTELYDGLSLLIYTAALQNISFEAFVQQEHQKIKNEPINESVSDLAETSVSSFTGFTFTSVGLGKSTTYFLRNGTDGFIKITDMTVEPENVQRDFHQTVSQMLQTLQSTKSPSTEGGSQEKAEAAVKSFASQDLSTPLQQVTIVSSTAQEFSNGCLGLEEPGEMCTQVITPGFEIIVSAGGKQKTYRTTMDGSIIKIKR